MTCRASPARPLDPGDLVGVSRLRGGSKKGAYRLFLDDDSTAVAYVWAESENYWPGHGRIYARRRLR